MIVFIKDKRGRKVELPSNMDELSGLTVRKMRKRKKKAKAKRKAKK